MCSSREEWRNSKYLLVRVDFLSTAKSVASLSDGYCGKNVNNSDATGSFPLIHISEGVTEVARSFVVIQRMMQLSRWS